MSSPQEYIAVIGCFQGCLLFGLLVFDARMTTASRILGVICLLIACIFLMPFLLENVENSAIAWTIGPMFFLPVALAPLGYLYCRSALLGKLLARRDLLHLLPFSLCFALTADVSILDPQEMARWIRGAQPTSLRLQLSEYVPVALAYAYAGWTGLTIWRYRKQANDNLANFDQSAFSWLLALQVFSLLVWFLKTLPGYTSAPAVFADIANLLLITFIYVIAIIQWRNPQFFTVRDLVEEQSAASFGEDGKAPPLLLDEPGGELDPATRAELFRAVKTQLESDRLYLDDKLTLTKLAVLTGLSKHHLSEVLNRRAGQNFYRFINNYRVDHVCDRLADGSTQKILDIALEAGFSSKSTFNAIFKQFTGQTPMQYRKGLEAKKTE
jgi:AraC-like DNA-binding protein